MPQTKTRSLHRRKNYLVEAPNQVKLLETRETSAPSFKDKLESVGLYPLTPAEIEILQINVGYMYDCDFNQMLQLQVEEHAPQHISEFDYRSLAEPEIVTGQHCTVVQPVPVAVNRHAGINFFWKVK